MELTGGTTKVNRLIKDLQADGSLLNFYSESVFDNPKINEIFDTSIDELKQEHGDQFQNHLLVGCFHSSQLNLLINSFKPCQEYFKYCYQNDYYDTRPCFGFINLLNQSVCLMSIGNRKGHFYGEYFNISMKNLDNVKEEFEDYDYVGIVDTIRESLVSIADHMNNMSYYYDDVTDEDSEEYYLQEKDLQRIFPNFELGWIQETFKPF